MTSDTALSDLADLIGVFPSFTDMDRVEHITSPDTQRALLRANGLSVGTDAEVRETLAELQSQRAQAYVAQDIVIPTAAGFDLAVQVPTEWSVLADGSEDVLAEGRSVGDITLPPLPIGVHLLRLSGQRGTQDVTLIVTPGRAPSVKEVAGQIHVWGVVAALYGLASRQDQGMGDYSDLGAMAKSLGATGAGFLGINPVHATGWAAPETISPYSPTHRGFLNTSHIAVTPALKGVHASNTKALDYPAHTTAQRASLQQMYNRFCDAATAQERSEFAQFCEQGGAALADFARFETVSETHGPDWRQWPALAVENRAAQGGRAADRAGFHMWMQWVADRQLCAAQRTATGDGMALGLYLDLAVGARLGGAESWGPSSAGAVGVSLGAPPDMLSPEGQNWQLSALAPHKLAQGRYAAFRQILAQTLTHCGLLRIDHALGLNRSYWIPEDGSPGGYIKQPFDALMAIIAIEAARAGTVIVGEDLGLVPSGFRERIAAGGLYGYTVLQYEKDDAGQFRADTEMRPQSLACFGTHDTPTLRGYWQGCDIDWWQKLSWIDAEGASQARQTRQSEKRHLMGLPETAHLNDEVPDHLSDHVHKRLAQSPAALVALQLDDILSIEQAQNLPGTIDEHPNWQRRYPMTISQIASSEALKSTAGIMHDAGRASQSKTPRKENK